MSTREEESRIELLQGTLDLLILRTLLLGPAHGHAIVKAIERNSEEVLQVEQGSLYPALHRLIKRGWISSEEGTSENNRRARFYRLTPKGRKQLSIETTKWEKLARAIAGILRHAGEEGEAMSFDELRRDLDEHIDEETRDNIERGMTPEAARAAALRKFGNVTRVAEETWSVWRWAWLDRLRQDIRYAARGLRRNPGFAIVAILTLALGIGMNTAVFSVVNAVLLRPLPYPDANRLVWLTTAKERFHFEGVSGADFFDWQRQSRSFERMGNYAYSSYTLGFGGEAEQTGVLEVSDDFLAITGAVPEMGRLFQPREEDAILLSHKLYRRRFGEQRDVVGKIVTIGGQPYTVCGVLPESYRFVLPLDNAGLDAREIEAYVRQEMTPESQVRGSRNWIVSVIAKLRPGVPFGQAAAEMEAIHADIVRQDHTTNYNGFRMIVLPLQEKLVGGSRRALTVLLAAVAFVLLIACANIANLLLARATSRGREIAIRAAIGAGRGRMAAQLLAEGLVLALAGGAAGLLLARSLLAALVRIGGHAVPRLGETTLDGRVLAFTLLVSVATGILFGLGPAISLARANLSHVLKEGGRSLSAGALGATARRVLMAAELAIALVLLTGAGLMLRSFWRMNEHPPGFDPERTLTMRLSLSGSAYRDRAAQLTYYDQVLGRLAGLPGVTAAGIGFTPIRGIVNVEGVHFPPDQTPQTTYHFISDGYCKAMGMRLVEGRWLADDEPSPAVMINQSLGRAVFGGSSAVGRRITIPGRKPADNAPATIVGVVADLRYDKLDAAPINETYIPFRRAPFLSRMQVLVRTAGPAAAAAETVRKLLADVDRTQPVFDVETLEEALADSIAPRRFNLLLLSVFATVALVLAAVGIYGVISYAVSQRTHEIGVRMALGARRNEIVRMVVGQGMAVAGAGIVVGMLAALGLTRLMSSLLYEVKPDDAATFGAVCGVLAAAAFLACCLPALRAAEVDPAEALRYE